MLKRIKVSDDAFVDVLSEKDEKGKTFFTYVSKDKYRAYCGICGSCFSRNCVCYNDIKYHAQNYRANLKDFLQREINT